MASYYTVLVLTLYGVYVSGRQYASRSWTDNQGREYTVSGVTVDMYTAREHCRDHNAALVDMSDLPIFQHQSNFIANLDLHINMSYWITGQTAFNGGCITLSVEPTKDRWVLVNTNCQADYRYICKMDTYVPLPIILQMSETSSFRTEHSSILSCNNCRGSMNSGNTDKLTVQTSVLDVSRPTVVHQTLSAALHTTVFGTSVMSNQLSPTDTSIHNYMTEPHMTSSDVILNMMSSYTISSPSNQGGVSQYKNETTNLTVLCHDHCQNFSQHTSVYTNTHFTLLDNSVNSSLLLNEKSTSRYRRKKTSAADHRKSSQAMGFLAVVVLATVFLTIAAMDLPLLYQHVKTVWSHIRYP